MKTDIYKACLGCLTGMVLIAAAARPAAACEAHAFLKTQTAANQSAAPAAAVMVTGAWVPVAPPGVKAHAAYLTLMNHGAAARAVTAVHSPQYASAALHVSETKDGVAMMQHLAQVDLPAGSSVTFKPHGLHIMLMGPKAPQTSDGTVDLTLTLDDGSTVRVSAEVRKQNAGDIPPMNHDHMNHGAMGHGHKGS